MAHNLEDTIHELALPLARAQGLDLWGITVTAGPTLKVAVYVDRPEGEESAAGASASIDQCEAISRQLGLALEVEDSINQPWVLEVSSPGLERRFFKLSQMRPFVGDMIDVKLTEPVDGRKAWRGRLLKVADDCFEIQPCSISDDGVVTQDNLPPQEIAWENVRLARRIHIFTPPPKPGKHVPARKKGAR